jgi:hypothetical protein
VLPLVISQHGRWLDEWKKLPLFEKIDGSHGVFSGFGVAADEPNMQEVLDFVVQNL